MAAAVVVAAIVLVGAAAVGRTAVRVSAAPASRSLDDLATATADALRAAGLTSRGGDAVRVEAQPDGSYRARLRDVPAAESALFAEALEEVLSPLSQPRYVIPRLILAVSPAWSLRGCPAGRPPPGHRARARHRRLPRRPHRAQRQQEASGLAFERAWNTRVGAGTVVYTGSPEGTGILAAQRGDDPFAVTTQIRTLWR